MNSNQQHQTIYTPYCYLIGWTNLNKFYYGVRYSKKNKCLYKSGCHPDDLWTTYFTSSKYVEEYCERYGKPDIIEVRRTFKTSKDAISWEERVLRKIIVKNDRFLNKSVARSIVFDEDVLKKLRRKKTEDHKRKLSELRKGKKLSEETKLKLSELRKGKRLSPETKRKLKNRRLSVETKRKISESRKGKRLSEETKHKMRESWKIRKISSWV